MLSAATGPSQASEEAQATVTALSALCHKKAVKNKPQHLLQFAVGVHDVQGTNRCHSINVLWGP